jgi:hypothetical protein
MNPESIDNEKNVVNPEVLEATPLKEVESLGGISQEKEEQIMHPQPQEEVMAKQEAHQEKIEETRKSIFNKFKELFSGNKEEDFTKDMKTKIKAWANQGAIEDPSDSDIATIMEQARADKFEGKVGNNNNKLVYRKASEIKWGTSGHSFGSGE